MHSELFDQFQRALAALLDGAEEREQILALRALRAMGPEAAPALNRLLEIVRPDRPASYALRSAACQTLGAMGTSALPAVPTLCALMLAAPDEAGWHIAGDAALALGTIGSTEAVRALIRVAQNPDPQGPGECAISSLHQLGAAAVAATPELVVLLHDARFRATQKGQILVALAHIGPPALAWRAIEEMLVCGSDYLQSVAIDAASKLSESHAVPRRIQELASAVPNERNIDTELRDQIDHLLACPTRDR